MVKYNFTLRNDVREIENQKIGRFDAFFPERDKDGTSVDEKEIPDYVKILDNIFKSICFKAGNGSIFISPTIMDPIDKTSLKEISYTKATKKQFFYFKIKKDKLQKWAFYVLIAASIGVLIDLSLAIGKIHVYFPCTESVIILLLIVSMILKITGLVIFFRKGFWESK